MKTPSHTPIRTCVGCRRQAPRAELLRVVLSDDGEVAVDPSAHLPGRGAWLHESQACLEQAERKRAFGRALRVRESLDVTPIRRWLEATAQMSSEEAPGEMTEIEGG